MTITTLYLWVFVSIRVNIPWFLYYKKQMLKVNKTKDHVPETGVPFIMSAFFIFIQLSKFELHYGIV